MDNNRAAQIEELKALRAELLSEYENSLQEATSTEEAVLLRQSLLEEYDYSLNHAQTAGNYEDDESDGEEPKVKSLTRERGL